MKILITGRSGQVSQALQRNLKTGHELIVLGRDAMDLANEEAIRETVRRVQPDLIINAAAYTAVDKAETDAEMAFKVNAEAPRILAEEAVARAIPFIHYSTDYVFDGDKNGPYRRRCYPSHQRIWRKQAGWRTGGTGRRWTISDSTNQLGLLPGWP